MKLNTRGISPLIATVLIIGFTVALAAVILIWGQSFTKGMQTSTEESANIQLICANDVNFDITAGCYCDTIDINKVKVVVKNDGNVGLDNITARFYKGATDVSVQNPLAADLPLARYEIKTFEFPVAIPNPDTINQIDLIPVITVADREVTCSNTFSKFMDTSGIEELPACTPAC